MPNPPAPNPHVVSLDPAQAKAAFETLLPRLSALPSERIDVPRTAVDMAAIHAFGVAVELSGAPMRERFEELGAKHFDITNLDDLGQAALATWYAATQLLTANAHGTEAKLPVGLVNDSTDLKARMMRVADYHFEPGTPQGDEVADIRVGTGYRDLAQDLVRLAALYRDNVATLKVDKKRYDPKDAERADALAGEIVKTLGASRNADQKTWAERVQRAWALLVELYDEVTSTAHWLRRKETNAPRYPSLVTAGRAAPRRAKGESETEEKRGEG